jgi:hypothetical protein
VLQKLFYFLNIAPVEFYNIKFPGFSPGNLSDSTEAAIKFLKGVFAYFRVGKRIRRRSSSYGGQAPDV